MVLERQLAIGALNLLVAGLSLYSQHLVIVALVAHSQYSVLSIQFSVLSVLAPAFSFQLSVLSKKVPFLLKADG